MRLKDLKETSSGGSTGAGAIAGGNVAMGSMKKRSIYGVDEADEKPSNAGTSGFAFFNGLRKNPSFVKLHSLNSTGTGYQAVIELDDGHLYDLTLSTHK